MKKIFLSITAVLFAGFLFTSANPSLDGRALVANEGVFPRGYFAKTVGYLPGDSIKVTNPTNGERVDILVIGSLDPSDGVAILLSPEAAEALSIKKNSNTLVKLTKRNGNADDVANGSAVITMNDSGVEEIAEELPEEPENATEEIAQIPEEQDSAIDYSENIVPEETTKEIAQTEEPEDEIPEEVAQVEEPEEEAPEEVAQIEELEDETPEEVAQIEEPEEEASEEMAQIEDPEDEASEEIAQVEESEDEVAQTEEPEDEIPEEVAMEEEELPPAEYVEVDDIPEDYLVEENSELVEEEIPEDYVCEGPESEYVEDEEIPEEVIAQLPEETAAELDDFPADEVEQSPEDEYVEADEIPQDVQEGTLAQEEDFASEEENKDEFDAIVLVPSDSNPPEQNEDLANNFVEEANFVVETQSPKSDMPYLTDDSQLASQKYYVQIAVYKDMQNVEQVNEQYGKRYPLVVLDKGSHKAVMVGPLSMDEYGTILERFRAYGFKDAFVKKTK